MAQLRLDDTGDPVSNDLNPAQPVKQPTPAAPVSSAGPVASAPGPATQGPTADAPNPYGTATNPYAVAPNAQPIPMGNGYTPTNPVTGNAWATQPTAAATTGVQTKYGTLSAADKAQIDQMLSTAQSTDDPNYWYELAAQHGGVASTGADWLTGRINQGDGALAVRNGTTQKFSETPGQTSGVFSDPATAPYEAQLNQIISQLNTPYQAPDFQPAIDQLKSYFQQLQGPAYTPQQADLIQTQSTDPLATQRDAARQQIIQHYAALGQGPSSGTVQQALQASDMNFEKLRTQTQSNFATNAVNLDRQNQATAAALGPQIASLETSQNTGNESRALQATNLAGIIPALAQSRINGANGVIQPINTASMLSQLLQANQTGSQNNAQFTNGIVQLLMQLVG